MGDKAKALFIANEVDRIMKVGVTAARTTSASLRKDAIRALKSGKKLKVDIMHLQPMLRDGMLTAHLFGVNASMSMRPKGLELGVYDKMLELIKKRLGMSVTDLNKKYNTQAFKVLKDASDDINKKLQKSIDNLLEEGVPTTRAVAELGKEFEKLGITPTSDFQLETIFRTQTQLAFSAARWQTDQDPDIQEILWGYKYVTVGDDRVRPEHEALDGTTLPKDDPFWNRFFPPNGWNCRCQAISIYEERDVVEAPTELEDGTEIEPDKGFAFNPGEALSLSLAYDPSQPRNPDGTWGDGGAASVKTQVKKLKDSFGVGLKKAPFKIHKGAFDFMMDSTRQALEEKARKAPIISIKLDSLEITQEHVSEATVNKIASGSHKSKERPVVLKMNGKYVLLDGTHRATAFKLSGAKTMNAHVLDVGKVPTDYASLQRWQRKVLG